MKNLRFISLLGLLFVLSACSGSVVVPPAGLNTQNVLATMPGKYVAHIQTGGWHLKTESVGFTCSGWSFDTAVDNAFVETMKGGLTQAIGNVEFVEAPLDPSDMVGKGYAAQIVVYQGNAKSTFGINPGLFSGTAVANMELSTNIAITDTKGMNNQFAVTGKGTGMADIFVCGDVDKAIAPAGQAAVGDVVNQSLLYVREGLHSKSAALAKGK